MYILIKCLDNKVQEIEKYIGTKQDQYAGEGKEDTPEAVTSKVLSTPKIGIDDLFSGLRSDSSLQPFLTLGYEQHTAASLSTTMVTEGNNSKKQNGSLYVANNLLAMKGRRFLEAKATYTPMPNALELQKGYSRVVSSTDKENGAAVSSSSSPASTGSRWGGIGAYFGFGTTETNSDKSSSIFNFSNNNNSAQSSSNNNIRSSSNRTHNNNKMMKLNVLFVQHQENFVLVESTPQSIADDKYRILISVPLMNTEVCICIKQPSFPV